MIVATSPTASTVDRLYARAVSLSVHPPEDESEAVAMFVRLAEGDPHVLGRARMLVEALVHERPEARHVRYGLRLLTCAWIRSIERVEV